MCIPGEPKGAMKKRDPGWFGYMGVSKNRDTPNWMVYNGKPYQNGCFEGTTIFGNIHRGLYYPVI